MRITIPSAAGRASIREFEVLRGGRNIAARRPVEASSFQDDERRPERAVDRDRSPWPEAGTVGRSLVATGYSYVDMFMAYSAADYYELYRETGDPHYRSFARVLQKNVNAHTDWDGKLGYPKRGLQIEGGSIDAFR